MKQGTLYYSIADEVFAQFPGYVRGIVLAYGVTNGESTEELIALLRGAEASVRKQLSIETILEHPRIASWRQAYSALGAKPSKYPPSMEAMARRVLKGSELPSISALVDIGNVISLNNLLPAGGHAIDVVEDDLALRPAVGDEVFVPFGSQEEENPMPGEIVFAEGKKVLTRRWTWRQANHTLVLPETTAIELNIDGLPPVKIEAIEALCREAGALIERFCGGRTKYEILASENPRIAITE